jgi:predicted molibdopterin-dependent oxidoreductase YjgC
MGARLLGAEPNMLPGRHSFDHKAKFEDIWKGPITEHSGKDTIGILQAILDDEIAGGFVFNADPARAFPDANITRSALDKLKFLVVVDTFLTDTARLADVVLPLATFAGSEGTRVNWEGRMQFSKKVIDPLEDSKSGCEIIELLAEKSGVRFNQSAPESVYQEMVRFLPQGLPVKYSQFKQEGYIVRTNSGRGNAQLAEIKYLPFETNPDYPFVVLVGNADHHRGTLTEKNESLLRFTDEPFVGISRHEADRLALSDGDLVRVESKCGKVVGKTRILPEFPDGRVLLPSNFQEMKVNQLMCYQEKFDLVRLTKM